ncbi:MAG TPA: O-antigen ligase family protein [Vicinamibacteria bacterium]|nr:O-antigen ligase family protein [Vicinamibacteria bacterium]
MLLGSAALLWLGGAGRARRLDVPPLFAAGGALYALAALASALAAGSGTRGLLRAFGMAGLVLVGCAAASLSREATVRAALSRAAAAGLAVSAALALFGVLLFALGVDTPFVAAGFGDLAPGPYARGRALFHHPNGLGSFALAATALAGARGGLADRALAATRGAGLLAVVLALSRAAVSYLLALLLARRPGPRRALAAVAMVAALALLATLSAVNVRLDPTRPLEVTLDDHRSPRAQAFAGAWRTLRAHPLLGAGPEAYPATVDGAPFEAHCTPLNVAARFGPFALLGLALLVAAALRGARRGEEPALRAGIAALVLDALTQDAEDFRHAWLLLGVAAGAGPVGSGSRERSAGA